MGVSLFQKSHILKEQKSHTITESSKSQGLSGAMCWCVGVGESGIDLPGAGSSPSRDPVFYDLFKDDFQSQYRVDLTLLSFENNAAGNSVIIQYYC